MKIENRKAHHEYSILQTFVCGIVLQGSEVKSLRAGKGNISDAYCYVSKGEIWMKNSHISKFESDRFTNHEEKRERKLLLNKREIRKIEQELQIQGITLIPLKIFSNEHNLLKLEIGICKGKKLYDKRNDIKDRDNERELDRIKKYY